MTSQNQISSTTLVRLQKTGPSEHALLCSRPRVSERQDALRSEAGAGDQVVERTTGVTAFEVGNQVVACLTQEQLEEVSQGANVRMVSYTMCRKPSNISASQSAELVVQFMAAAALLDQTNVLSVQHLGNRPAHSALDPNNVALIVPESKTNIIPDLLLCHLVPNVDVFFCYHEAVNSLPEDNSQGLYFMLALKNGARTSAQYPPNSQETWQGTFAEAYTKSAPLDLLSTPTEC